MKSTSLSRKNTSNNALASGDVSRNKVFVGMSGGVDSSVSALLLKQAGYDVTGVFIRVWQPEDTDCGWKNERRDAMRVAAALDIPFLTFDFSTEYKKEVVDYMIQEYKEGRTPNPDVMCNRHIKFGSFLDEALKRGANFIATGHYAKNVLSDDGDGNSTGNNGATDNDNSQKYELLESDDKNKDQSYFLWTLKQCDLKHVLFPVGHLEKPKLRKIAEKNNLPVFDKKDSQGVCFIGHLDMKAFLKANIKAKKGSVVDIEGNIIGEHDGAVLYTVGERHGFIVYNKKSVGGGNVGDNGGNSSDPHYIIFKNLEKNTLTVATNSDILENPEEHAPKKVRLHNVNWINKVPELGKKYSVRIRYRQEKQPCEIKNAEGENDGCELLFDRPQKGVAPGQSAVIYDGEVCMGGGIMSLI